MTQRRCHKKPKPVSKNGDSDHTWQWDYFYNNHLGNVRAVVTEQRDTARYRATFDTGQRARETALFANINETAFAISNINQSGLNESCTTCILAETGTSYPAGPTTEPNAYTSRLNGLGKRIGAAITLKVMAGNKVDIGTKAWRYAGLASRKNRNCQIFQIPTPHSNIFPNFPF